MGRVPLYKVWETVSRSQCVGVFRAVEIIIMYEMYAGGNPY